MLDKNQVEHLANLARLAISEEEVETYAKQMSQVLVYFDQMNEAKLDDVEPTSHITGLTNVTRPDEEWSICSDEALIAMAPEVEKRQIKVKAIFE